MRLEVGKTLGDWTLVKYIGHGPLGMVFFAEHRFTKKKTTLKILPEELAADRSFLARFEEEVTAIAALDHPSIAKTYNVSFMDGVYFLATECVVDSHQETKTLAQYLGGRKASLQEIEAIVEQVAHALDYAHTSKLNGRNGFAHGNLKPNNILIAETQGVSPVIKIADFGLFRIVGSGNVLLRSYKAAVEQLAIQDSLCTARVGQDRYPTTSLESKQYDELLESLQQNIHFLSVEQRKGDWSQPMAADIWSFGVLVYWLLTSEYPEGVWDISRQRAGGINWGGVVRACLERDPHKRPSLLSPLLALKEDHSSDRKSQVFVQSFSETESVQDKQVKEYAPEKRETKGIVPLMTDMVVIQEGMYYRGSNHGCRDEIPRHAVRIASFSLDVHPVTNEQFVRFLDFIGDEKDFQNHDIIRLKDSRIKKSAGKFSIERGYGKHPVVGVTWYGAMAYAQWVDKRLPTEAEWEVACCGGLENPTYPTGEDIEKTQANFFSSDTTPVGSYPANGYGIYDIVGNVYEWCLDWYEYNYYEYSSQEPEFPKGPIQGVYRVLRGGCWKSLKEDLRCAKRHRNNPGAANGTYGFRCAKDIV